MARDKKRFNRYIAASVMNHPNKAPEGMYVCISQQGLILLGKYNTRVPEEQAEPSFQTGHGNVH